MQAPAAMLARLKAKWRDLKALPAGRRFQIVHEQQAGAPAWVKAVVIAGAVVAFGIGILLSILPGPAFVFFGLAGALLAIESAWVARLLDRTELALRRLLARFRRWRRSRTNRKLRAEHRSSP